MAYSEWPSTYQIDLSSGFQPKYLLSLWPCGQSNNQISRINVTHTSGHFSLGARRMSRRTTQKPALRTFTFPLHPAGKLQRFSLALGPCVNQAYMFPPKSVVTGLWGQRHSGRKEGSTARDGALRVWAIYVPEARSLRGLFDTSEKVTLILLRSQKGKW